MKNLFLITFFIYSGFLISQNNAELAESYFRQGDYEKASQLYESLEKENPFNTRYLKRLITCFQETNEFKKAEEILKEKLLKNPNQFYLHVEIGYNFDRQQKKESAKKEYLKAMTSIETNPNIGGIIGRMFQENNLLDYALQAYFRAMELNENSRHEFQIAQIYGEKGLFKKMFDYYVELIDRNDNYANSIQRFMSKYIDDDPASKNNTALKKALLRKSIRNPKNIWNELLSWLFIKQKEYRKAFIQEKALFRRDPRYIENLLSLAKITFENDDFSTSKNCFSFILQNSNFIEDKLISELYLLKIGVKTKDEEIYSLFEQTLQKYGVNSNTIDIQVAFADFLTFQNKNPLKAIDILEKAFSLSTSKFEKAKIKLKLGDVFVFTERFNKAILYFSQVENQLKNHPLSQEARFKVAQTSYFKGDFSWAKTQLKVLKSSTSQLIANDAVALFLVISDNEPKDSIPSGLKEFAKASLLAYQRKNTEAISTYSTLLKKYQGQDIEDEALFNQAKLFIEERNYEKAIANLLRIISINPEGLLVDNSYYLLAEVYNNNIKDLEKASEYYQKIIFEKASSIYLVEARKKYRKLRGDRVN